MKQLPIVSILFVIGLALINTDTYGLPTLSASLYYAIATCVFCLAFVGTSWRSHFPSTFPPHVLVFNVLCAYIAGHGLITGTFGMSHFYWLANGLFFNTIHLFWCSKKTIEGKTISLLGNGLLLIAFMESMVVIAQFLRVIPSRNTLFSATGTWVNPNVTAIFLALSLHFILKSKFLSDKRVISLLLLAPVLLSIGLLQSRTAYLVGLLALGWYFRGQITAFLKSRIPFSSKIPASVIIAVIILPIAVLLFQAKKDSTAGRLLVLKNSTLVIRERPLTGTGFGLFEKTYNQFVAQHELPSNGQVNMAYNDLIELSIEGGIIALLLWSGFLALTFFHFIKKGYDLFPLLAILIVQFTNFGFQAMPVFAVFLLYIAYPGPPGSSSIGPKQTASPKTPVDPRFSVALRFTMMVIAFFVLLNQVRTAKAYKELNTIKSADYPHAIEQLEALAETLKGHSYFHEKFGDAYLKTKDELKAGWQYQQALEHSSYPVLFVKYGYALQRRNSYDSSLYYYQLAKNLEPYKFATRVVILRMYEQKKDTANMLATANEILALPAKVESENVEQIKRYANNILLKIK